MKSQEKFLETMNFNKKVSPPLFEFGYWASTINRWYTENLPRISSIPEDLESGDCIFESFSLGTCCEDLRRVIKFDEPIHSIPFSGWVFPEFETEVIEETEDSTVLVDEIGVTKRIKKTHDSIPEFLDWPVKDRSSWEKFKYERLDPENPSRYPDDFPDIITTLRNRDYPLMLAYTPVGFFGSLRMLLGAESLLVGYYDFPDFIKEIISYLVDFWIHIWSPILSAITPDCIFFWEDMCYKNGPLISPAIFKEFMLSAYKKTTSFLKNKGVENIILDTDGDCWKLIPLFLDGGISGLFPMEVAAGMDVVQVRKCYPKLQIMGGIDKRALAKGENAIDDELSLKIPYMLDYGGYIPFTDHLVPPDVSFINFKYYRQKLERMTQM